MLRVHDTVKVVIIGDLFRDYLYAIGEIWAITPGRDGYDEYEVRFGGGLPTLHRLREWNLERAKEDTHDK